MIALPSPSNSPHIRSNGEVSPEKTQGPGAPTRAKAARPATPATPATLADLLNPAINKGTAGMGSGTGKDSGLQPPPDNSWERRKDFSEAHKARKSAQGFSEAPQSDYTGSPISGLDPALAKELGLGDEEESPPPPASFDRRPPPSRGRWQKEHRGR